MKIVHLIVCLLCGSQLTFANLFSWFEGEQPNHDVMQGDDPGASGGIAGQVQSLLEAMKVSFVELANKRNSWFDRYNLLAQDAVNQSAMIDELLFISRTAMPIIWTAFMANGVRERAKNLEHGEEVYYTPPNQLLGEPVPHPLRNLPTQLTEKDDFVVEVGLLLNAEANVGIRLMFEPEHEADFDWDNDDILLGVHLRWHFDYGNDREVSLHEKYNGRFQPGERITPEEHWPKLKVGEKFIVVIAKGGDCFSVFTLLGEEMHVQMHKQPSYNHEFCPRGTRRSKMVQEPKRLRVVVNEDHPHTGELEVHSIAWYPTQHD